MFAVLHVADFSLHAVLRLEPGRAGRPAALLDGANRKAVIVAGNAAARAHGVDTGQTAAQALAHCGELLLRTWQPAAEAEAQAALQAAAFTLSPKVEATARGTYTADVSGLDAIRRRTLLHAAVQRLERSGLPTAAGLAATPLLALYAARCAVATVAGVVDPGPASPRPATTGFEPGRGQAYACNSPGQRSGQSRTLQDDSRAPVVIVDDPVTFLAPLPLAVAEPEPELADILRGWGVRTLGELTALPKAEVAHRLGAAGLALWERAAGETTRVLRLVTPPRKFVATMEFEHEVETLEPLLFTLRRFVDRLAVEIAAAHRAAVKLILKLKFADDSTYVRSFRLPEPTAKADVLFRVLDAHLESLRAESPIVAVGLRLKAGRPPLRQRGLFETELHDSHGFAETLARVMAVLSPEAGSARVGTPVVLNTHRPDAVVLETPPTVVPAGLPVSPTVLPPLGLPLRRWRPPAPVRVVLTDDRPASLWSQRINGTIVASRGPWYGAGDWWEAGRAWQREEWDVELSEGGLYRVIRTAAGWFVEGEYD